jgi:hypothetical protein
MGKNVTQGNKQGKVIQPTGFVFAKARKIGVIGGSGFGLKTVKGFRHQATFAKGMATVTVAAIIAGRQPTLLDQPIQANQGRIAGMG